MERSIPQIILMVTIMLAILGTSLFYIGRKLFKWLCIVLPNVNPKLYLIIPAIIVISYVLAFLPINMSIKKYLVWFNFCFIGVCLYFLLFFLLSDAVLIIGRLTKNIPSPVPHNILMIIGYIIVSCVTLITGYGIYNGKQIKQIQYTVELNKNTSIDNLNIVLIADTHLGHLNSEKWLLKIVDSINSMAPDIVVMAGDIFNDNFNAVQKPDESIQILRKIKSTYGVYACMGNHDGGSTYPYMLNFLKQGGVTVLQDEYVVIEDKFIILGRTEISPIGGQSVDGIEIKRKTFSKVFSDIEMNDNLRHLPVIVMDHNPAHITEYENKADIILAGHTHKGQVFPGSLFTKRIFEADYGHYQKDKNSPHVIVTSGAGLWGPPLRIGTNNEVVKIDVRFK